MLNKYRLLLIWIVNNLLNESQLSVVPPMWNTPLRHINLREEEDA